MGYYALCNMFELQGQALAEFRETSQPNELHRDFSLGQAPPPVCLVWIPRLHTMNVLGELWKEEGQDIAEYAIMMAVILAIVVGTIRLIGSNANNVFSSVASAVQ